MQQVLKHRVLMLWLAKLYALLLPNAEWHAQPQMQTACMHYAGS